MGFLRNCDACGKEYEAQRKTSQYCSTQCRSRMHTGTRVGRVRVPDDLRWEVLKRDQFRCRFCGAHPGTSDLRVDHLVPIKEGGAPLAADNLVTTCHACNSGKGTEIMVRADAPAPGQSLLSLDLPVNEFIPCQGVLIRPTEDYPHVLEIVVFDAA